MLGCGLCLIKCHLCCFQCEIVVGIAVEKWFSTSGASKMAVTSGAMQELPALHSECSALLAVCNVGHSYGAQ